MINLKEYRSVADYDISEAIEYRDKEKLWDILSNHDQRIDDVFYELNKSYTDKIKDLIESLQFVVNLAEEYPDVKYNLMHTKQLWDIARQFIIDKKLDNEFNVIANEKMRNDV